ncbi:hypothetical protein [Methylobacterium aquaticum]|uniref:glycine-rich domain-containing protein n=1 Tax=Methylobacterium aquaticum TaxID=270351 RepID=UPI0019344B75|nr:hypothetical protein [Methylobacterium aquaticum]QRE76143.1 hypothetical protein F1D61_23545 [Methylobacterium aquaticum]
MLTVATGASNATVTLVVASTAGDGATQVITKADAGAGIVIVVGTGGVPLVWLPQQGDVVRLRSNGSAWQVVQAQIASWLQVVTSSGPIIAPPFLKSLDVTVFKGGTGGNSGGRQATTASRAAVNGGAGGLVKQQRITAAHFYARYAPGASIPCTIDAGGAGGASVTTDSTAGAAGVGGSGTSFGSILSLWRTGTTGVSTTMTGTGGASGGAAANSTATANGGNGDIPIDLYDVNPGPVARKNGTGDTASALPTAGGLNTAAPHLGGSGGGGGAYISGQAGADGGIPGGGGGAGAPSDTGYPSGKGGNGGRGEIRIAWNFAS